MHPLARAMALNIHWSALLVALCDLLERIAPVLDMYDILGACSVTHVMEQIDKLVGPAVLVALEGSDKLLRHLGTPWHWHWALCMA